MHLEPLQLVALELLLLGVSVRLPVLGPLELLLPVPLAPPQQEGLDPQVPLLVQVGSVEQLHRHLVPLRLLLALEVEPSVLLLLPLHSVVGDSAHRLVTPQPPLVLVEVASVNLRQVGRRLVGLDPQPQPLLSEDSGKLPRSLPLLEGLVDLVVLLPLLGVLVRPQLVALALLLAVVVLVLLLLVVVSELVALELQLVPPLQLEVASAVSVRNLQPPPLLLSVASERLLVLVASAPLLVEVSALPQLLPVEDSALEASVHRLLVVLLVSQVA